MSVEKLRTLHIAWLHRKVMVEDFRTQYAFFNGHAIDCNDKQTNELPYAVAPPLGIIIMQKDWYIKCLESVSVRCM